jgi:hypothetical protein
MYFIGHFLIVFALTIACENLVQWDKNGNDSLPDHLESVGEKLTILSWSVRSVLASRRGIP